MKIGEVIKKIETKFDTTSISYKGLNVWLDIRNRFFYKLSIGKESNLVIGKSLYFTILKSSFYGFFNWFKKYDAWFLGSDINRVEIDGKYYDRLFDYPAEQYQKSLLIEFSVKGHFKRKKVYSKHIVSRSALVLGEKWIELFLFKKTNNLDLIDQINKEYKMDIDPNYSIKKMVAQYKMMRFLLRFKKPKHVFIAPSYTAYGYIKAFKEKGIKVIEMQHGVINKEHFGYNVFGEFDRNYFPDYLLTFGQNEKEIFTGDNKSIKPENIISIGSYYIDYMIDTFTPDEEIENLKKNYKKTCAVSLQDCDIGEKLIPFLLKSIEKNEDILFLIKRRRTELEFYQKKYTFPKNIHFVSDLDVYKTILHADFHITAYSSCALEAPALGKMNILINLENKASEYYGEILPKTNSFFVNSNTDFEQLLEEIEIPTEKEVRKSHAQVFENNFKSNMNTFLSKLK